MLIDSHCHLDRLKLDECGGSLAAAIQAAHDVGVTQMLCVCINAENRTQVRDIACQYPGVYASAGIHPSDVSREVVTVEELQHWCDHPRIVAIGETGLDYHYTPDTVDEQKLSFQRHLQAASALALPVIVHTREASADTLALIREFGCRDAAGVLHCFTESWEMAKAALDMQYYISISGIVTFRNADELRDVVKKIPADRLLVETDSPYLAPVPHRGQSNQPKHVKAVAEYIAQLRGQSYEALAEQTSENFFRLFTRAEPL